MYSGTRVLIKSGKTLGLQMEESEDDSCPKCKEPVLDDDPVYRCDSCFVRIHRNCSGLSPSEIKVMPTQKRLLLFICDGCKKLIARMPYMVGMLQDIKRDVDMLKARAPEDAVSSKESYAGALKSEEDGTDRKSNWPALIVRPKVQQNADKTKSDVQSGVDPNNLQIGVRSVKTVSNGGVVIKCTTRREVDSLRQAAEVGLGDGYTVQALNLRSPRMKIVNYRGDRSEQEIEQCIRRQNSWISIEDELSVKYIRKSRDGSTSTVFMQVSPSVFKKAMKMKRVFIDWDSCPIFEDLSVVRCFNCQGYFHKSTSCRKEKVCGKCTEQHETKQCRAQIERCVNCVLANDRFKMQYATNHLTSDPSCSCTKYHTEVLRSRVNYG